MVSATTTPAVSTVNPREKALEDFRKKIMEHKEIEARLKQLREDLRTFTKDYDKSENDLKALQSVGQVNL
ncbi:unnamed protein product [Rotaria magnacalcarata]|uniref:Uncharacterized protein n=1 Tax=Rotaria magnacalcarata TaxID=392030 RepID=A0A8S2SW95_9BILA|nr:unnamed protein product [Rotaria magnacalcarata]CAF4248653.1 unnamed protein product [Rotaria magnacalcarata]CAF4265482.1 unnamed protein product [Rotaria magnacalcarata]CAF4267653.1 unnamed protein product [Rotaria magnacalcarata]